MPASIGVWVVNTMRSRVSAHALAKLAPARARLTQELEAGEQRVPLVEVIDVDLEAERLQRAHAADAEHDLLRDAIVACRRRTGAA